MLASLVRTFKKILLICLCIAAIIFGALFAFENTTKISPVLVGLSLPHLSVGYYLIITMVLGLIIGIVLSSWKTQVKLLTLKRELSKLKKAQGQLQRDSHPRSHETS